MENVQISATKLVDDIKNMDYTERLQNLDLPTLWHRRERGHMIQVWKHFNTYDKCTVPSNFRPLSRTNQKHPYQPTWNRPKDGSYGVQSNSFYFRVANTWNTLPNKVVETENLNTFKSRLDAAWMNHAIKFTIDSQGDTTDQERFVEAF